MASYTVTLEGGARARGPAAVVDVGLSIGPGNGWQETIVFDRVLTHAEHLRMLGYFAKRYCGQSLARFLKQREVAAALARRRTRMRRKVRRQPTAFDWVSLAIASADDDD